MPEISIITRPRVKLTLIERERSILSVPAMGTPVVVSVSARPRVTLTLVERPRNQFTVTENGIGVGPTGKSAYEIWLDAGNVGTELDFLESLVGPAGSGGDLHYIFTQNIPATVWAVAHNMAKHPSVSITDTAGNECQGEFQHIDINNLVITFSAGFAGVAILN